jgi:hypothetical protein
LACGTTRLDAGSNGDSGTPTVEAGLPGVRYVGTPSNSFDDIKCDVPAPDWLAGAWQGEFDTYALRSGSKAVRIQFTGAPGPNGLCGTVTFGEGVPPPIATDPQAPPPGENNLNYGQIIEGFAYEFIAPGTAPSDAGAPARPLGLEDQRVRFGITLNQVYKSWCNLQLAYWQVNPFKGNLSNPPTKLFRCAPEGAYAARPNGSSCDSGFSVPGLSCTQNLYCFLDVCECNANYAAAAELGCTVNPSDATEFDLSLAGTILSGNVALLAGGTGMHLTRAP